MFAWIRRLGTFTVVAVSLSLVAPAASAAPAAPERSAAGTVAATEVSPTPTDTPSPEPTPSPTTSPAPEVPAPEAPAPEAPALEAPAPEVGAEEDESSHGPTAPLTIEPWDEPLPFPAPMTRALAVPNWQLPFERGQRWSAGGPHRDSDGTAWGALDFSPGSSTNKRVVSIADGRVYRITCPAGWFLGVDHGGGWRSEYYHLANAQAQLIGQWVPIGTYLGEAASTLPCGGSSTGPHVHLSILYGNPPQPGQGLRPYYPVDGMRFGDYRVRAGAATYQGRWEDMSGRTVITNFGCCLASTTPAPQRFTSTPAPTLSGTPAVGSVLTAATRAWQPAATLQYQWRRDGAAIAGATTTTYQVTKSDRGARITVAVTGTRAGHWPATVSSGAVTIPTPVVRRAGATRYETSAAISAATHSPGVHTVYLASGRVFADALAAAAAAGATDAPVLLTAPDAIPGAIAAELDRLNPGRIVIVGGPSAIGEIVVEQARPFTTGDVERLSGDTRYHTSALVSSSTFTSGATDAYVAAGTDFADALSAAAAAGAAGAPVLLSKPSALPEVVAEELDRLAPRRIVIVGGPAAIDEGVRAQLESFAGEVIRLSGGNRFETAAAVAAATTSAPAPSVYLASGLDFADAVSGAAAAASASVPILLTRADFLPPSTGDSITRLQPPRIYVLGGTAAIPERIARAAAALAP